MKGNFDILLIILLAITGVFILVFFGPTFSYIGLAVVEIIIIIAIVILAIRYSRSRR
jgi:hypothetical membrane protein